jgi:hypothetical protein
VQVVGDNRARSPALGELQRRFPTDYRQHYASELARARTEDQADQELAAAHWPSSARPHRALPRALL